MELGGKGGPMEAREHARALSDVRRDDNVTPSWHPSHFPGVR